MKSSSPMKSLMDYAGSYRYLTGAAFALSAISSLTALVPFFYIWRIISQVLETAPHFENAAGVAHDGWMALAFSILSMLIYVAALWCSHLCAFRVQRNIRCQVMEHILKLPAGFMNDWGSGKVRKIVNDCSASTETYLAHIWPDKAGMIFTPLGLIVLLLFFDWRLGLLCLVPVGIAFIFMAGMMGDDMKAAMKEYQNSLETMSSEAVEYIRGVPVVKTFGQTIFSFERFRKAIDEYSKWTIAYTKSMRPPMLRFTTAINAIFAIIIAFGIAAGASARTPQLILNLIFYTIITPVITTTLNKVMYAGENEMLVTDCLSRIQQIMDIKPLPEPEKAETPSDYSITFDHVSFSYAGADKKALNDISFTIESGEHVALVGPSGGGKSTIASLIPRFWDVESGRILIGGVDVRNIPKETLSDMVSFVFQDSSLLKMSVFDNVRLSHPDATREEVLQALHEAQCDDIIEKLPNGIDTVVGAAGVYVSGGEKQRLNIARVMLKNAPILILDEATAFADPDNETKVQAAFANMSRGKTVLMIAHRLSTVTDTSRIFVIKDGQMEESGNHKDLTASNGLYHRMWKDYCTNVGTFGPESAVRLHSDRGNLPYSNAKPRQIPFLDMQRMDSNDIPNGCLVESR